MTERDQDFTYDGGDDLNIDITVTDGPNGTGDPVNLTGATIYWWLLDDPADTTALVEKSTTGGGITITDAANGVFRVNLDPADAASLNGRYHHKAKVQDSGGDKTTVTTGEVKIHPRGPVIP